MTIFDPQGRPDHFRRPMRPPPFLDSSTTSARRSRGSAQDWIRRDSRPPSESRR